MQYVKYTKIYGRSMNTQVKNKIILIIEALFCIPPLTVNAPLWFSCYFSVSGIERVPYTD